MDKLVFETDKIGVPESVIAQGYQGPATVHVYQTGKHAYCLHPCIGISGLYSMNCDEIAGKLITTQPSFLGTKDFAIGKAREMLKDVENWPNY